VTDTVVAQDGRRRRSEKSRALIIDAMLALVGEGDMDPSAARVAERAGVGLRSVFRHFEDMDGVYRGMSARIEADILPLALKPFVARDWRGKLFELLERRAVLYERILPWRVAGSARRFQSPWLMEDYRRLIAFERTMLESVLPKPILSDETLCAALDIATGFESWRRLRHDLNLKPAQARLVVERTVEKLIA
jgi:AcrR family transcriptional regulator